MSMWLYQLSPKKTWNQKRYRTEIWEGERWAWGVGRKATKAEPEPGDTIVFFYAPSGGGGEPGFYGWAVITEWLPAGDTL